MTHMDGQNYNFKAVKIARTAAGYETQAEAAARLKVTEKTVSRVETGVAASFELLRDMALLPACEKIVICGGLRRGKVDVGDIDFVCLPKRDPNLFGSRTGDCSLFEATLARLVTEGTLLRLPGAKNGRAAQNVRPASRGRPEA